MTATGRLPSVSGVIALLFACVRFDPSPEAMPGEFVIHETAYQLEHVQFEKLETASYQALIAKPAETLVHQIRQRLEELGWAAVSDANGKSGQFGIPKQQWTRVLNGKSGTENYAWVWVGEWRNARGEKVLYELEDKEDGQDVITVDMQVERREKRGHRAIGCQRPVKSGVG